MVVLTAHWDNKRDFDLISGSLGSLVTDASFTSTQSHSFIGEILI